MVFHTNIFVLVVHNIWGLWSHGHMKPMTGCCPIHDAPEKRNTKNILYALFIYCPT